MKYADIHCMSCRHRVHSAFRALPEFMLPQLDSAKTVHRFERGQVLYYAGTPVFAVYCLLSGVVKLSRSTSNGHRVVLRLVSPGKLLGLRSVLSGKPSHVTAEVLEPAHLCIIPRTVIEDLLAKSPPLGRALLCEMAGELDLSEGMLLDVTYLPAEARVARLLLMLADPNGGGTIVTSLRRQDLAESLRLTPQTFSRVLHELTVEGILDSNRNRIVIRDPERLRQTAQRIR